MVDLIFLFFLIYLFYFFFFWILKQRGATTRYFEGGGNECKTNGC